MFKTLKCMGCVALRAISVMSEIQNVAECQCNTDKLRKKSLHVLLWFFISAMHASLHIHAHMHVCMHACMHARTHARTQARTHAQTHWLSSTDYALNISTGADTLTWSQPPRLRSVKFTGQNKQRSVEYEATYCTTAGGQSEPGQVSLSLGTLGTLFVQLNSPATPPTGEVL